MNIGNTITKFTIKLNLTGEFDYCQLNIYKNKDGTLFRFMERTKKCSALTYHFPRWPQTKEFNNYVWILAIQALLVISLILSFPTFRFMVITIHLLRYCSLVEGNLDSVLYFIGVIQEAYLSLLPNLFQLNGNYGNEASQENPVLLKSSLFRNCGGELTVILFYVLVLFLQSKVSQKLN